MIDHVFVVNDDEFDDFFFKLRNRKMADEKSFSYLMKHELEQHTHRHGYESTNYGYIDYDDERTTIRWPGANLNMPFKHNSHRHYREQFHEYPVINELE